ncbi:hypothetical protein [Marmoricola sp. RAF53]|uniref:hypothetical protein n=1 Tax=Marmoricola sp. RAF53 TaxID=3233059 RepID=UPI003F953234
MRTLLVTLALTPLAALFLTPAAQADESPGINDTATLVKGTVTRSGDIRVVLRLTCPKRDRWTASMTALTIGSGAPDDIFSSTDRANPPSGRCSGRADRIVLKLVTQPINGVFYPAPRNCSAEYGVTISGAGWDIAFDRGGADGGPDGPGPVLCLQ